MEFCKKCKSLMKPVEEDMLECPNCGFIEIMHEEYLSSKDKIPKKPERKGGVVEDKNINATYEDFICDKCGYNRAEVIERQPYISDEDSLTFLKCGKCSWTKQLARKIG